MHIFSKISDLVSYTEQFYELKNRLRRLNSQKNALDVKNPASFRLAGL